MSQPEFDQYAKNYDSLLEDSIPSGLNEEGHFAEYKVARVAALLKNRPIARILDFGCGAGRGLPFIAQYFPGTELWGYDVSPESLKIAKQRAPQANLFSEWQGIGEMKFDVIIAANVFHHIPLEQRLHALRKCHQMLTENGKMFLFEHNPYNPLTRWIFERCPFDIDAEMLTLRTAVQMSRQAGFSTEQHGYTMFFPRPLAALRRLEPYLTFLPIGAQYYVQMEK